VKTVPFTRTYSTATISKAIATKSVTSTTATATVTATITQTARIGLFKLSPQIDASTGDASTLNNHLATSEDETDFGLIAAVPDDQASVFRFDYSDGSLSAVHSDGSNPPVLYGYAGIRKSWVYVGEPVSQAPFTCTIISTELKCQYDSDAYDAGLWLCGGNLAV
jgi:hypothetical protein